MGDRDRDPAEVGVRADVKGLDYFEEGARALGRGLSVVRLSWRRMWAGWAGIGAREVGLMKVGVSS